jgi:hypothetical protein
MESFARTNGAASGPKRRTEFKLAEALGCSVAELRPAESVARPTKQRRAWAKSPNAPSSPTPLARPWGAVE